MHGKCANLLSPISIVAMSVSSFSLPDTTSHPRALHLSQQAPALLQKQSSTLMVLPFSFRTSVDSPEIWAFYENLFLSCLRTGDDKSAHMCLERLTDRFGASNERLMSLRGLYREAVAEDDSALTDILKDYEDVLKEALANTVPYSFQLPRRRS